MILSDTDEDEVREMLLCLQNGTTLKAQQRRNAMSGKMRDFIKDLAGHQFFASCSFTNARYTFDQLAAQMSLIELVGEPTNVRNARRNQHELPIDQCESRDCAVPRKDRLTRSFNLLPDARPFSLPRRRSGKNALKGFRRRGAIA